MPVSTSNRHKRWCRYGTKPLYEAFPEAHFILIEPLKEYEPILGRIAQQYHCDIHHKAVGNQIGTQDINIDTGSLTKSSLALRTPLTQTGNPISQRTIEVTTLDTIYRETPTLKTPILLKIDTEGHELAVLQGAETLLTQVDTVIAEVSIAQRFERSYTFEDLIAFMGQQNFQVFSFLSLFHLKREMQPRFSDVVFKRRTAWPKLTPIRARSIFSQRPILMPQASIALVMTVYNRANYLKIAINSVLGQTWTDFELLIWDDGSSDNSLAIAQHYATLDPRVRVIAADHQGLASALKAGVAATNSPYLGWVDSDDRLAPTALEQTIAILKDNPQVGMVYTNYQVIDKHGNFVGNGQRCKVPYSKD